MSKANPDSKKRPPSHSAKQAAIDAQNALLPVLSPPAHVPLRPQDIPFWNSLINARARELWTDSDLEIASFLAQCKADIAEHSAALRTEGSILAGAQVTKTTKTPKGNILTQTRKGADFLNPRLQLIEQLTKRLAYLSRMIHVHANATTGQSREEGKKNTSARKTKKTVEEVMQDKDTELLIPSRRTLQ